MEPKIALRELQIPAQQAFLRLELVRAPQLQMIQMQSVPLMSEPKPDLPMLLPPPVPVPMVLMMPPPGA